MANRYWVGGTDIWNSTAGLKWATTTGGVGGAAVPTSVDDVFFDANSGSVAVSLGSGTCRNFVTTGFPGNFSGSNTLSTNGPTVTLGRSCLYNISVMPETDGGSVAITSNGFSAGTWTFGNFSGKSGTYNIQDTLTSSNGQIFVTCVTSGKSSVFNANNNNINAALKFGCGQTAGSSTTINMGSGTWTIGGSSAIACWDVGTGVTINSSSSTIVIGFFSVNTIFSGQSNIYNNVFFSNATNAITITGSNTFNELKIIAGKTVNFTAGTTQTVTTFTATGTVGSVITLQSTSGGSAFNLSKSSGTVSSDYLSIKDSNATGGATFYAGANSTNVSGNSGWIFTAPPAAPTVTTQAVTSITSTDAVGNGNVTSGGSATVTQRGICWNTTGTPTTSDFTSVSPGTTGAFTANMTSLARSTLYYVRAYAINSVGTSYGAQVTFSTLGFTNPGNIYSSDNVYTTFPAVNGNLTVELSKDGGLNYNSPIMATFTGSDTIQTYGTGTTELWGTSWLRSDMVNALFYIRLSQGAYSQVYKNFGFATGSQILTGIEVGIEGNYTGGTMSLDLLRVKIYYGSSILPVTAGSQAYASNGRKAGEGPGAGTGVLVTYDGSNWNSSEGGVVAS